MLLEDLFNASSDRVQAMVAGLKQKAEELGLPFGTRTRTYNSRLAQELGLWAEDRGRGGQFHLSAFHAYFVDGKNLADRDVLLILADKAQLPRAEAEQVLDTRSYRDRVDAHWQESRQLGVTAVPTFIVGLNRLVGAQSYQALAGLVQMAGAGSRSPA